MAFKKFTPLDYKTFFPTRQWLIRGFAGAGKSLLLAELFGEDDALIIDADHRASEILDLVKGDAFQLSDIPADNVDVRRIAELLKMNMPGSGIKHIAVDSLTAIIAPLITDAMMANRAGENTNHSAAFVDKALAVRLLQDAITRWGTNTYYVYHMKNGRNNKGKEAITMTIPATELGRIARSTNVHLEVGLDGDRRYVKVLSARRGRSGMVLYDEEGYWKGIGLRIEQAIYEGLSREEQDAIEVAVPTSFGSKEDALQWAFEQDGVFKAMQHVENTFNKLKEAENADRASRNESLLTWGEMTDLWIGEVLNRKAIVDSPTDDEEE